MRPSKITIHLGGIPITIAFLGRTGKVADVYRHIFRGFIREKAQADRLLQVSFISDSTCGKPFCTLNQDPTPQVPAFIHVPNLKAAGWLKETGEDSNGLIFSDETLCTRFLNGLLMYSPESASGRIYIFKDHLADFRSLYRLFWLYLAQVLGEAGGCFLHAAALVRRQKGYLFLGDSGSGKSTLSRLCREYQIFSDDGPVIGSRKGGYRVFPSPFHQQDSLNGLDDAAISLGVPIVSCCFLVQDEKIFFEKIPKKEAFSLIMNRYIHYFHCLSTSARRKLFDLFFRLCDNKSLYYFHFSKKDTIGSYLTRMNGG